LLPLSALIRNTTTNHAHFSTLVGGHRHILQIYSKYSNKTGFLSKMGDSKLPRNAFDGFINALMSTLDTPVTWIRGNPEVSFLIHPLLFFAAFDSSTLFFVFEQ